MISIAPFRALMPTQKTARRVAALPYDVVDRDEALKLAENNPLSFLRVSRAEIALPSDVDPYSDAVYDQAAANFERLRREAPLACDDDANIYVYSLVREGRRQTGLVAAVAVDDYDNDRIKKHELTRQKKEDDRTRHTMALRAHTGPIFLTYKAVAAVDSLVEKTMAGVPLIDVTFEDGVAHQVWRVSPPDCDAITTLFAGVPALYVADGHHRAKSASRTRAACRDENPVHTGDEAYNRFLGVMFPAPQLEILPYNRIVRERNGLSPDAFMSRVRAAFDIGIATDPARPAKGAFSMYHGNTWHELRPKSAAGANASIVARLDVSVLQEHLLRPILGIVDQRTDPRIDFVGGIHGTSRLESLVQRGDAVVAFAMHPVTIDELMAVSDAGMIMPPKSTWFEPKLRDGLFGYCF